ncbi:OsmC family protein [Maridesulfovibrio frigidus]|uniref:OsmC family protein n=1 Tax=Maridesulfovibrio frigidus TaxID=340956 RepID=UPI0004E26954|nr:OsmC family protein [Maridesulfovibrio frigidus]
MKKIEIEFGSGKKLKATGEDFVINTDQPVAGGGEGSAPNPLDLFISSLATCAAHYARKFCDSRDLSIDGLSLTVEYDQHPETAMISKVQYQLSLPEGFPEKYKAALLRTIDLCTVKKHLLNSPSFELEIV